MKFFLSNDDGYNAPGLMVLQKAVSKLGSTVVVAPSRERSTSGHSLTLHKPLRIQKHSENLYAVSGTPADSVYLGLREVVQEKPDFVLSGINRGANLGQDIFYSGTVAAAREASMMGIPSMAVSLSINFKKGHAIQDETVNYHSAASWAVKVLKVLQKLEIPPFIMFNLNVPDLPLNEIHGLKLAHQGFRYYGGKVLKRVDHRGRWYYWVGGQYRGFQKKKGTDCDWIEKGYATITPIQLDTTCHPWMEKLSEFWELD